MENLEKLVGKKIKKIFFNENYLKFETDDGNFCFTVEGDCCSHSVFYDFYGVKKLLENSKVLSVKEIQLTDDDKKDNKMYQEEVSKYGYEIVTENKEFGEQTSVFSFRNYSNGYYGGWMEDCADQEVLPEINDDVIETRTIDD